eukprot:236387-Chlamydomonas_euryale.AAC.1
MTCDEDPPLAAQAHRQICAATDVQCCGYTVTACRSGQPAGRGRRTRARVSPAKGTRGRLANFSWCLSACLSSHWSLCWCASSTQLSWTAMSWQQCARTAVGRSRVHGCSRH